MEYIGKLSTELTDKEFGDLHELFNLVYHKNIVPGYLNHKYNSPVTGYSYHGLMYDDEKRIVGSLTYIPFAYNFYGKKFIAGCAVDLMVQEQYRNNLMSVSKMHQLAVQKSAGTLDFVYAVPNQNSFLYFTKFLKWNCLGKLNYYLQVINISALKKQLTFLNFFSRYFFYVVNHVGTSNYLYQSKAFVTKISDASFNDYRFGNNYQIITDGENIAWYCIKDEEGTESAYIVDIMPETKKWLRQVAKKIYLKEKKKVDVIMYVGNLPCTPLNLPKVPNKMEPRKLKVVGKILNPQLIDERIYDLKNWHFNLADFDTR
jgi:hypothetical protein